MNRFALFVLLVSTTYAQVNNCPPPQSEFERCYSLAGLSPTISLAKACSQYPEEHEKAEECGLGLLRKCYDVDKFLRAKDLIDLLCHHQGVPNLSCVFVYLGVVDSCTGPSVAPSNNEACIISDRLHWCAPEISARCGERATEVATEFYDKRAPSECRYSTINESTPSITCPPSDSESNRCYYQGGIRPTTSITKVCSEYREEYERAEECYLGLLRNCYEFDYFLRGKDLTDLTCHHQRGLPGDNLIRRLKDIQNVTQLSKLNCVFVRLGLLDDCQGPSVTTSNNEGCMISNKLHKCAKELKAACSERATETATEFYDKRAPSHCPYSTSDGALVFVTPGVMWLLVAMVTIGQP